MALVQPSMPQQVDPAKLARTLLWELVRTATRMHWRAGGLSMPITRFLATAVHLGRFVGITPRWHGHHRAGLAVE